MKYWEKRHIKNVLKGEKEIRRAMHKYQNLYYKAYLDVNKQLKNLYKRYGKDGIIAKKELEKKLGRIEAKEFRKNIQKYVKKLGFDSKEMYYLTGLARVERYKAFQEQIMWTILATVAQDEDITFDTLKGITKRSYRRFYNDFLKENGLSPSIYNKLNSKAVDIIVRSKWNKDHFSARVWRSTLRLATELPMILGTGVMAGQSIDKMSRIVKGRFGVRLNEATRLIRTEGNYVMGQANLQTYIDAGAKKYKYVAYLDDRTSNICRHKNGKIYYIKSAKPGVNYPPLHPNCRSTTRAITTRVEQLEPPQEDKERFSRYLVDKGGKGISYRNPLKDRFTRAMNIQMKKKRKLYGFDYDYNAELNEITRIKDKKILEERVIDFIDRVPEDHPLRSSIVSILFNNWERKAGINAISKFKLPLKTLKEASEVSLKRKLKNANVPKDVRKEVLKYLNTEEKVFIQAMNVDFVTKEDIPNARNNITLGEYNGSTHEITIDPKYLKKTQTGGRVILHETGHAIDFNSNFIKPDILFFSQDSVYQRGIYSNQDVKNIVNLRVVLNRDIDLKKFKTLKDKIKYLNKNGLKRISTEKINYYSTPPEVFAESYALYKMKPNTLKKYAPKIYKNIKEVQKYIRKLIFLDEYTEF